MHPTSHHQADTMRLASRHIAPAAALLLLAGACSDSTAPGTAPSVSVARSAGTIELRNPGSEPLAYLVAESEFAALALFGFCTDPGPGCVRLPARTKVTVPYAEIAGYEPGATRAIVYSWRVVPDGKGGYRTADLSSQGVGL